MDNQSAVQPVFEQPKNDKKKKWIKPVVIALLIVLLLAGTGAVSYLLRDSSAVKQATEDAEEIRDLQTKVAKLEADIKKLSAGDKSEETTTPAVDVQALAVDAVTTKDYTKLDSYMADSVMVIIAASEGLGPRNPDQVIVDMQYLDAGTAPWDFELDSTILSDYRSGDYGTYFPVSALVGKAANGYVVSFGFNADGDISTVFMSVSDDIL